MVVANKAKGRATTISPSLTEADGGGARSVLFHLKGHVAFPDAGTCLEDMECAMEVRHLRMRSPGTVSDLPPTGCGLEWKTPQVTKHLARFGAFYVSPKLYHSELDFWTDAGEVRA
jgi:hypothetical protein